MTMNHILHMFIIISLFLKTLFALSQVTNNIQYLLRNYKTSVNILYCSVKLCCILNCIYFHQQNPLYRYTIP
jgi:hypothetical protein